MSLLLLGGGQPQNSSASLFKITLMQTSNSAVIYENDNIDTFMTYLNSYTASVPITVQFNDNTIYQPASGSISITSGLVNGANLVTFKSKPGFTATIDGQLLADTVVTITGNNKVWDGINVINGIATNTDTGGTIIRISGSNSNITIKNCLLRRGFVGIRGTTAISNLTIDSVVIEEVVYGSIRIGGGAFTNPNMYEDFDLRTTGDYDMTNVVINNITCYDTLAGGNVPGSTLPNSPLILVKRTETLSVTNTRHSGVGSKVYIEESGYVTINKCIVPAQDTGDYGIAVVGSDVVTIANCFVKSMVGPDVTLMYLDVVRNLSLIHNTFVGVNQFDSVYLTRLRRVLKVVGNLFSFDYYGVTFDIASAVNSTGYTPTMANDFQEEHDNVFNMNNEYENGLMVSLILPGNADLTVRKTGTSGTITEGTYRSTYPGYGVNTQFGIVGLITLTTRTNPDSSTSGAYYLGDAETTANGRNMITGPISNQAAYDQANFVRSYPTDAGAFDRDATSTAVVVNNLNISPSTIPATTIGASYSQTFTTTGGNGSYTYNLIRGPLPGGLTLSTSGTISGTVSGSAGSFIIEVGVRDTIGNIGRRSFLFVVT